MDFFHPAFLVFFVTFRIGLEKRRVFTVVVRKEIPQQAWCSENGCYAESNRNFNQALRCFAEVVRKHPREGGGQTTLLRGYRIKGMPQAL